MASETNQGSYVVVPREDYEQLYNKQYTQLTSLQKKVDPDLKRQSYFETVLKTHYPKVYQDMIRNDYILTRPTAIDGIQGTTENEEISRANMHRQLSDVTTDIQSRVKLSNPLYSFTQRYLNNLVNDSTISPHKRQLLYSHLNNYAKRIPMYINRPLTKTEASTQAQVRINARPSTTAAERRRSQIPIRSTTSLKKEDGDEKSARIEALRAIRQAVGRSSPSKIPRRSKRLREKTAP